MGGFAVAWRRSGIGSRGPLRGQSVPFFLRLPRTYVPSASLRAGSGLLSVAPTGLAFDILGEHFFGVDGDEDAAAAGQDFVFLVQDFGGIDVLGAADFDFAAFHAQRFVQGDGFQIFDRHLSRERYYVTELVYFAHGVVEDAGDDATVAVAGRAGVAVGEAEVADEGLALLVEDEFQAHAFFVVLAADEAIVLLHFVVAGFVALGLGGHARDFNLLERRVTVKIKSF
jgi:hypothetical protein